MSTFNQAFPGNNSSEDSSDEDDEEILFLNNGSFKIQKYLNSIPNFCYNTSDLEILKKFNCNMIQGLDGKKGVFLILKKCFFIVTNFMIDDDDEIIERDSKKTTQEIEKQFKEQKRKELEDLFLLDKKEEKKEKKKKKIEEIKHEVVKIEFDELEQVFERKYVYQDCGIEFFCTHGTYFVIFDKLEKKRVYNHYIPSKYKKKLIKTKKMTKQWMEHKISNYEYLMFLNTVAGRTYNDLTQYPVFPWVFGKEAYNKKEIDLDDPSNFRNLSLPMGAIDPLRKEQFEEKFKQWPKESKIPAFHYGTHYSSAAIVLHYLIRMEPYTSSEILLQGGKFDLADRLFCSIQGSYLSSSSDSHDVKELIPEFFSCPSFLTNLNYLQFGKKQDNTFVNDVILPEFCQNDPWEFIRIHRKALESSYVSANLHHWIDLIFGYKQTGIEAEKATNVFYYLTYDNSVDIEQISDPIEKKAIVSQIMNFGQTPHQLFTKSHPQRKPLPKKLSSTSTPTSSTSNSPNLEIDLFCCDFKKHLKFQFLKTIGFKVGKFIGNWGKGKGKGKKKTISVIPYGSQFSFSSKGGNKNRSFFIIDNFSNLFFLKNVNDMPTITIGSGSGKNEANENNDEKNKKSDSMRSQSGGESGSESDLDSTNGSISIDQITSSSSTLLRKNSGKNYGKLNYRSIYNYYLDKWKNPHNSNVSCFRISSNNKFIIFGGINSVVSVWQLEKTKINKSDLSLSSSSSSSINSSSKSFKLLKRFTYHSQKITSIDLSVSFGVIVSSSLDGSVIIWDLKKLKFIKRIQFNKKNFIPYRILINHHNANILVCGKSKFYLFDVNGKKICQSLDHSFQEISEISFLYENEYSNNNKIITGHKMGFVRFWEYINKGREKEMILKCQKLLGSYQTNTELFAKIPKTQKAQKEPKSEETKEKEKTKGDKDTKKNNDDVIEYDYVLKKNVFKQVYEKKCNSNSKITSISVSISSKEIFVGQENGDVSRFFISN